MTKIAIDAGHGSNTAGKRTPDGYREHWINVRCAHYCELALKRCGFEVLRVAWNDTNSTDDIDLALSLRQAKIKSAKCDASVSFHANAHGDGSTFNLANGVETLIHKNPSYVKDSESLARKIQSRLLIGTKQADRGVKTQNLAMCNCIACGTEASVLVEVGFMTNKHEAELMKTDVFCKEQAEDVARGICDYYGVEYNEENEIKDSKLPYIVRVTISDLNIRKTPSAEYSSNKLNKYTGKGSFTIVDEQVGPVNSRGKLGRWGLLKSYQENRNGWICLDVGGVDIV